MASYLNTFVAAVRTAVNAAWADVTANGVYQAIEMARINLGKKVANGELPFAVMDLALRGTAEWGGDNETFDTNLSVYYVADDGTAIETLIGKLETFRDYLGDTGLSAGQVIGDPVCSWSLDLPLNRYFMAVQQPFLCGAVIVPVLTGERHN